MFIIITFYTKNTAYEQIVKKLIADCEKYNLPIDAVEKENLNDWNANTRYKSEVCLCALNEYFCDIIWLDADAEINQKPELFYQLEARDDFDICVHFLKTWYNPNELLSGTMYLKNTPNTKKLMYLWNEKCKNDKSTDQTILQSVLFPELRILPLPKEYIKIANYESEQGEMDAVIYHTQASRIQRGIINAK
jgi:hypothetical protein